VLLIELELAVEVALAFKVPCRY